jgi:hypothetical protein
MPRGKQSAIRYGQKKQEGQSDTAQLIEIKQHLKKKHKILAKREPYLLFRDDKLIAILDHVKRSQVDGSIEIKNPDLLWMDKYGTWIIEVDGAVHDRKVEKTRKRNELFISNHIKLIVVNLSDIKELGLNIYEYIDDQIMERIKNG